jgi:glutamate-1-semialdehyde 2,1-aminomutase
VPYNDASALEAAFAKFPGEIAAFVVEPVAANMGLVPPAPGYLEASRDLTRRHGALLVFDEVISGFRVAAGGAQEVYGVRPDLTTLGKILGGGLPIGAYGGSRELMEKMAPSGPVYQAGTLSGNPLATSAGLAMLAEIERRPPYAELETRGALLESLLRTEIEKRGLTGTLTLTRAGSLVTLFFAGGPIRDFASAKRSDTKRYAAFFHAMRERGVFLPPAQFEAWFVSKAHEPDAIRKTARAAGESLSVAFGG